MKLDFILLDLDMPIMNGFEACRQISDLYNTALFKLESDSPMVNQSILSVIEEMSMAPLMVAYSALVNDTVR